MSVLNGKITYTETQNGITKKWNNGRNQLLFYAFYAFNILLACKIIVVIFQMRLARLHSIPSAHFYDIFTAHPISPIICVDEVTH